MEPGYMTWESMSTYTGALSMVFTLTELTKNRWIFQRIPTRLWTYIISLCVMLPSVAFTEQPTVETVILTLFNGAVVALAANGGYDLAKAAPTADPTRKSED